MQKPQEVILKELFKYIFQYSASSLNLKSIDSSRRSHLKKKIEINFPVYQKSVDKTFTNNFMYVNLVQRFITDQLKVDEQPFINFVDLIQSIYMRLKNSGDINSTVDEPIYFDNITNELLNIYKLPPSEFFSPMKSVVLYIFELCDFGKVPDDKKIKKPKSLSSNSLFD
jgi:hypothetical protein